LKFGRRLTPGSSSAVAITAAAAPVGQCLGSPSAAGVEWLHCGEHGGSDACHLAPPRAGSRGAAHLQLKSGGRLSKKVLPLTGTWQVDCGLATVRYGYQSKEAIQKDSTKKMLNSHSCQDNIDQVRGRYACHISQCLRYSADALAPAALTTYGSRRWTRSQ